MTGLNLGSRKNIDRALFKGKRYCRSTKDRRNRQAIFDKKNYL